MTVKEQPTPHTKGIKNCLKKVDFKDTFSTTNHTNSLEEVARLVFDKMPPWIERLMNLRNYLVKFMGLKTQIPEDYHPRYEVGGYIGFFKIYAIYADEIIMGADDKHLNFRASIYDSQEKAFNIKVSTLVEYNRMMGRIYMFFVKPFHRLVVKRMVRQASEDRS